MQDHRVASLLVLFVAGCAHWGESNVADVVLGLPSVTSTFLAPPRAPLAADAFVVASKDPPPPGSTVLAASSAQCYSTCLAGDTRFSSCLEALLEETRRLGGNGLFGVHAETHPRGGTSLIGSITFDPSVTPVVKGGREVELRWKPRAEDPAIGVFLEQRQPDLVLGDGPSPWTIETWHKVCQLPCTASLDPDSSYLLVAPTLIDVPPLVLKPAQSGRVDLTTRQVASDYSHVWWGLGFTLVSGGLIGGAVAYALANPGKPAVDLSGLLVPCFLLGVWELLTGPEKRVELAITPRGPGG